MRTNLGLPSDKAFKASRITTGWAQPPPIQPESLPSAWMIALSPGLPELGGWQRTTVAMAKVSPLANSSADCFNSCSSIAVPCLGQSPIWPSVAAPQEMLQCQQAFQVVRRG